MSRQHIFDSFGCHKSQRVETLLNRHIVGSMLRIYLRLVIETMVQNDLQNIDLMSPQLVHQERIPLQQRKRSMQTRNPGIYIQIASEFGTMGALIGHRPRVFPTDSERKRGMLGVYQDPKPHEKTKGFGSNPGRARKAVVQW